MVYCFSGERSCIKSNDEKLSPSCYYIKEDCEFNFKKNDYCFNVFDKPMTCFRYDRNNPGQQCFPTRTECQHEMERVEKIMKSEGSFPIPTPKSTPSPTSLPISSATPTPVKKFYIWGIVIALLIILIMVVVAMFLS